MTDAHPKIRHGQFHDLSGPPIRFNDITFIPAVVTLNGMGFDSVYELADCVAGVPAATLTIVRPGNDAPWVLGRLMRLFHVQPIPVDDRGEKTCHCESFLAVLHQFGNMGIPFECSDYYGKTGLTFSSEDPPDDAVQVLIADAFWKLLLSDPADLTDYESTMYHSGAGVTIRFGVEDGEPFMQEEPDE